jgi:hypothetical protein
VRAVHTSQETHAVSAAEPSWLMLFGETAAVYCENRTEHTDTLWAVRTSQKTTHVSTTESNRLMLCGKQSLFAVRTVRNTHTLWTVRTSQETHHVSATEPNRLMLCEETVAVCCENRTEHTYIVDSPYLTGDTSRLRYRAHPVNAVWDTVAVCCENRTEHIDTLWTVRTSQ